MNLFIFRNDLKSSVTLKKDPVTENVCLSDWLMIKIARCCFIIYPKNKIKICAFVDSDKEHHEKEECELRMNVIRISIYWVVNVQISKE